MALASAAAQLVPPPPPPQSQPDPDPTLVRFARGVIARLEVWPALRVAVEQGWGGSSSREKRRWLASEIVDAFDSSSSSSSSSSHGASTSVSFSSAADRDRDRGKDRSTPDAEYVALMLAQVLEDEFEASFEDGSVEAVAADVVGLWGAGEEVVREWERKAEGVRGKRVDVREVEGDDEDEWEDEESGEDEDEDADAVPQLMSVDAPAGDEVQRPVKSKPVVDEDGFTLVQKGRR